VKCEKVMPEILCEEDHVDIKTPEIKRRWKEVDAVDQSVENVENSSPLHDCPVSLKFQ
jgi:hypothetical protein